jgi:four helix bundle protein
MEIKRNVAGYKNLLVWQIADDLAKKIYKITNKFPTNELYGIISQLKRASLSVPLNIVEGYVRNSKKEFHQFLKIALGSVAEVGYLLEFSHEQGFLQEESFKELMTLRDQCGQLLWKLFKSQSL